jgi:OmpR family response regulator RpaB
VEVRKTNILVIVTKETTQKVLVKRLTFLGYNVFLAVNQKNILTIFQREKLDLVIFDLVRPESGDGEFHEALLQTLKIPLIILAENNKFLNQKKNSAIKANNYLLKPLSTSKLEACVSGQLKDSINQPKNQKNQDLLYIRDLIIDVENCKVSKNGRQVKLTPIEFSLLKILVSNTGDVVSRISILSEVWGYIPKRAIDSRVVDVYISRLRSKLEDDSTQSHLIITSRGSGYMLQS